jgi:hypothetical protein
MKSPSKIILIATLLSLGLFASCDSPNNEDSQNVSDALAIQDSLNEAMNKLDRDMKEIDSAFNSYVDKIQDSLEGQGAHGKNVFKKFKMDSTMEGADISVEEYEE